MQQLSIHIWTKLLYTAVIAFCKQASKQARTAGNIVQEVVPVVQVHAGMEQQRV